jgi:hypothetical protein
VLGKQPKRRPRGHSKSIFWSSRSRRVLEIETHGHTDLLTSPVYRHARDRRKTRTEAQGKPLISVRLVSSNSGTDVFKILPCKWRSWLLLGPKTSGSYSISCFCPGWRSWQDPVGLQAYGRQSQGTFRTRSMQAIRSLMHISANFSDRHHKRQCGKNRSKAVEDCTICDELRSS